MAWRRWRARLPGRNGGTGYGRAAAGRIRGAPGLPAGAPSQFPARRRSRCSNLRPRRARRSGGPRAPLRSMEARQQAGELVGEDEDAGRLPLSSRPAPGSSGPPGRARLRAGSDQRFRRPVVLAIGLPHERAPGGIGQFESEMRLRRVGDFERPSALGCEVDGVFAEEAGAHGMRTLAPATGRLALKPAIRLPPSRWRWSTPPRLARAMPPMARTGIQYSVKWMLCRGSRKA